jgi:hypothetical protein
MYDWPGLKRRPQRETGHLFPSSAAVKQCAWSCISALFFVARCLINSRDCTLHIPVHQNNDVFRLLSSTVGRQVTDRFTACSLVTQQVLYYTTDITRRRNSEHPWLDTRITFLLCLTVVLFSHPKPAVLKLWCVVVVKSPELGAKSYFTAS